MYWLCTQKGYKPAQTGKGTEGETEPGVRQATDMHYIYIYIYVYMYVYLYVCTYIYIYIYICIDRRRRREGEDRRVGEGGRGE